MLDLLGVVHFDHHMINDAIKIFQVNVEQFPDSGWANYHLAMAYLESGR